GRSWPGSARSRPAGSSARLGSSGGRGTTSSGPCSVSGGGGDGWWLAGGERGAPTYVGHLAAATRELLELPDGLYHVAADGDCTWADFAEAIFEEAGLDCRVHRITTAEFGAPAPRPAYSVLRSERDAPQLPHWRDGLHECMARIGDLAA